MTKVSLSFIFIMLVVTITSAHLLGDPPKQVSWCIHATRTNEQAKLEYGISLSIQDGGSDEGVEGSSESTGATNSESEDGNTIVNQKLEDLSEEVVEFRREWKESNQDIVDQLQAMQAIFNASTSNKTHTRGGPTRWGMTCEQHNQSQSFSKICFETNAQNYTQGNDTIICGAKWKAPLQCGLGIGINSAGIVEGPNLAASSTYSSYYSASQGGRLDSDSGWCPQYGRANEWVFVNIPGNTTIYGAIIQGIDNNEGIRNDFKDSYVKTYKVTCRNSEGSWLPVTDEAGDVMIFQGTVDDNDTPVAQKFPQPITCYAVKIYVQTWHRYPCLRWELLTC